VKCRKCLREKLPLLICYVRSQNLRGASVEWQHPFVCTATETDRKRSLADFLGEYNEVIIIVTQRPWSWGRRRGQLCPCRWGYQRRPWSCLFFHYFTWLYLTWCVVSGWLEPLVEVAGSPLATLALEGGSKQTLNNRVFIRKVKRPAHRYTNLNVNHRWRDNFLEIW
jgi:hypothetical protein